jgi:hypothetical protein
MIVIVAIYKLSNAVNHQLTYEIDRLFNSGYGWIQKIKETVIIE